MAPAATLQEPWLDTVGPVRDLLLAIFSWVAEQERDGPKRVGRPLSVAISNASRTAPGSPRSPLIKRRCKLPERGRNSRHDR